jgi:hypothetical protein|nr:MAG TPA: hypothetical protein [Crassvirales sp.]
MSDILNCTNIAKSITYKGNNVETLQSVRPNEGTWKSGDKVFYDSGTDTFSIYTTTWKHF